MRIDKDKALAIFVDYQEKLIPAQFDRVRFIDNSVKLAIGLITLDVPIIVSEQYPKGLGTTVEDLKNISDFPEGMPKTSFSCILDEDIKKAVKESGAKHIIISGCETHICVLQTVMDLIEMGLSVYLITDCCTSRTEANHNIGIERAKQEGAFVSSLEGILFELQRVSGGDAFKTISNLIK